MSVQDRKSREFERRGQEILDAALRLFKSDAWEDVTVEQIAQQAEIGKGTIYKHFASKDEIYARLAIDFQHRTLARLNEVEPALPVTERFRRYLQCAWKLHLSSKELHRVFLYCSRSEFRAGLPAAVLEDLQRVDQEVSLPLESLLAEGIEQGVFPRKPVAHLLFGARAAFWGAIQMIWSGYLGEIDRGEYLEELTNFVLAGLVYQDRRIAAETPRIVVSH
ncbi:MAG: TetR/AcrR family transcriptional regulator [Burkholderiaceae bacterium]